MAGLGRAPLFSLSSSSSYVQSAESVDVHGVTWEVAKDPMALGYLGLAQGVPLVLFQLCGGVPRGSNQPAAGFCS